MLILNLSEPAAGTTATETAASETAATEASAAKATATEATATETADYHSASWAMAAIIVALFPATEYVSTGETAVCILADHITVAMLHYMRIDTLYLMFPAIRATVAIPNCKKNNCHANNKDTQEKSKCCEIFSILIGRNVLHRAIKDSTDSAYALKHPGIPVIIGKMPIQWLSHCR